MANNKGFEEASIGWGLVDPQRLLSVPTNDPDFALRLKVFEHVQLLTQIHGQITNEHIAAGLEYEGQRIPLVNPQRGIFKPKQMKYLLSIRTVFPRPGRKVWYDDQRSVQRKIYQSDEVVEYAFMGTDPEAADNRWLREAMDAQIPIIYFLGFAPGFYHAIVPAFIVGWDAKTHTARIAFGDVNQTSLALPHTASERRYALRSVKQRLHQASFRAAVIDAYKGRCALSRLPEPILLDAAHIVPDAHEKLGQPVVTNGIPLSKIHHAAFDAHLIGIDPDFKIHVSEKLLMLEDGPMLEALKDLHGGYINKPSRDADLPDRDRLALRFEQFKAVA